MKNSMAGSHPEIVRRLLEAGAFRSIEDQKRHTALDYVQAHVEAGRKGVKDVIPILKEYHPVKKKIRQFVKKSYKSKAGNRGRIQDLINQLRSPDYSTREAATHKLKSLGRKAMFVLKKQRNHENPEVRDRIRQIINRIAYRELFENKK